MDIKLFNEGLESFSGKDYKKAMEKFLNAMESTDNIQLIARCKSYIAICKQQLEKNKEKEDKKDYGYAVFLLNNGRYGESKKVLEEVFKGSSKNDTYLYLYAIAEAGEHNENKAEKYLRKAMEINPSIIHTAVKDPLLNPIATKILGK